MAGQQQRFERVYPVPAGVLFDAFRDAAHGGKYRKVVVDEFAKTVVFRTKSFYRVPFHCQGQVTEDPGGARIVLTAGLVNGGALSLASGTGRASEISAQLFADISRRCAQAVA
ncbi:MULTISPECIES: hypothetical protein [Arthrobacter]|uniref:Uncharacterized protein n=1 Tax=Arthrobacter terricola TaxID=2547396 RepID=A0A4R5KMI8_9MICC|nr:MULTISPECIES: hypothetical protein [Arthrobacter]MBT8160969.1 hypothetical protein [Arthrobacter sp. GN70]TDF96833.1 hypothetical protein E1809_08910 [Arthrobacter terricola]